MMCQNIGALFIGVAVDSDSNNILLMVTSQTLSIVFDLFYCIKNMLYYFGVGKYHFITTSYLFHLGQLETYLWVV